MTIRFGYDPKLMPPQISSVGDWPHPFPDYPAQYQEAHRIGAVGYHFTVGPDGRPTGAQLDSVVGGEGFGGSVLFWLRGGCVHFRPDLRDGAPVATPFPAQTLRFALGR
jgi:hypothetical protein